MGVNEDEWRLMEEDDGRWRWKKTKVIEGLCNINDEGGVWMKVNELEWRWIKINEGEWRLMKANEGVRRKMKVNEGKWG